jgi:hypothetical protein
MKDELIPLRFNELLGGYLPANASERERKLSIEATRSFISLSAPSLNIVRCLHKT